MKMTIDKFHARFAYESLLLQQPHIHFDGLWVEGDTFLISCPSLGEQLLTQNGESLSEWFIHKCKPICCPIEIASEIPNSFERVAERSESELARLHGEPLTLWELYRELYIALPKTFPLLTLESGAGKVTVHVSRALTPDEEAEINIAFANIGVDYDVDIYISPERKGDKTPPIGRAGGDLTLIISNAIKGKASHNLASSYEEDEEYWLDNRVNIFSSDIRSREDILKDLFSSKTSACFIDATVFPPNNIRTYLPIYQRLVVAMPLANSLSTALEFFRVQESELLSLVERGRVQFVLPQSIERYDLSFISKVIEVRPDSILFSRRLAAASIAETRARLPFLYPPFGAYEKREILRLFTNISEPLIKPIGEIMANQLAKSWIEMQRNISNRGGMGTANSGIGIIIGELIHTLFGKDVRLELITSSMSVEWAAAVGAAYCPVEHNGYSDFGTSEICASTYSGVRNAPLVNPIKSLDSFMEGLLTLNNDAPVLEVDDVFTSSDIERLGDYMKGIHEFEEPLKEVESLNKKIKKFETNQKRLERLDILGLGGVAVATAMTGNPYVPFGVWLTQYMLKNADPSKDCGGKVIDWVRGINTWTSTDAVLISRLRSKASGL
jgi:hypothetical protein